MRGKELFLSGCSYGNLPKETKSECAVNEWCLQAHWEKVNLTRSGCEISTKPGSRNAPWALGLSERRLLLTTGRGQAGLDQFSGQNIPVQRGTDRGGGTDLPAKPTWLGTFPLFLFSAHQAILRSVIWSPD